MGGSTPVPDVDALTARMSAEGRFRLFDFSNFGHSKAINFRTARVSGLAEFLS
jgi:hypothetical protein